MRRDERLDRAQLDCRHYPSPSVACSEVQRGRGVLQVERGREGAFMARDTFRSLR